MWFKNFRHKKIQIAIIFMIVMLSVLLLNAAISMIRSLDSPMKELWEECNSAQMVAYPYCEDEKMLHTMEKNLKKLDQVKDVQYLKIILITEGIKAKDQEISAFCDLAEYNDSVYKDARVIEGDYNVAQYKDNECALPKCIGNEYGLKVGDTITIGLEGKHLTYTIKAFFADAYDMSTAYDSRILVRKMPELKKKDGMLFIYTDGADSKEIVSAYHKKFGDMGANVTSLESETDNSIMAAHIAGGIFLGVGMIMLIVSCIVIYFIVKNAMLRDAKKIATYKTMGYSYHDILFMYLRFYAAVIGTGAFAGVCASIFISNYILNSLFENIGEVANVSIFNPGIFTLLVTTAFVLTIVYLIIRSMKNIKPVYALNGMSNRNTKKRKQFKGNSNLAFSPLGIAVRNFTRNKRGAAGVAITSIVTVFAINFAVVSVDIAYNMENTNDYWFAFDKSDFVIGVNSGETLKEAEKVLKENENVVSYNFNTINEQKNVNLEYQEGMDNTVIYPFVYKSYEGLNMSLIEGRNPENENETALATVIADALHKSVGDYITLSLAPDKKVSLLITGIFQTYMNMGDTCRLTGDVYKKNNVPFDYNTISVYIKDGADCTEVMDEIKSKLSSSDTFTVREKCFESIMKMIAAPQKAGIPPLMALVMVIGAINIFSIVLLKNAVNKKTNQIYKSIGYSSKDLMLSNLIYVVGIAIFSVIVAVPVLLLSYSKIITACLTVFQLKEYPMNVNFVHIVLVNILVVAVFALSTIISSRSLRKVNVRDLVVD